MSLFSLLKRFFKNFPYWVFTSIIIDPAVHCMSSQCDPSSLLDIFLGRKGKKSIPRFFCLVPPCTAPRRCAWLIFVEGGTKCLPSNSTSLNSTVRVLISLRYVLHAWNPMLYSDDFLAAFLNSKMRFRNVYSLSFLVSTRDGSSQEECYVSCLQPTALIGHLFKDYLEGYIREVLL